MAFVRRIAVVFLDCGLKKTSAAPALPLSQAVHRAGGHDDTFESDQPEAPTDPILTSAHL